MKNLTLLTALLLLTLSSLPSHAWAQERGNDLNDPFNPIFSYNEITVMGGAYTNAASTDGLHGGTSYSVDYGRFSQSGIGFRGGVEYIDELDNDISLLTLPLKFAYRIPITKRTMGERALDAAEVFLYTRGDLFSSFATLIGLQMELNAGITPGMVLGEGYEYRNLSGGAEEVYGVSVEHGFATTFDLGMRLGVRIWRFNLLGSLQYHYLLTNNFRQRTPYTNGYGSIGRGYVSAGFGASFLF